MYHRKTFINFRIRWENGLTIRPIGRGFSNPKRAEYTACKTTIGYSSFIMAETTARCEAITMVPTRLMTLPLNYIGRIQLSTQQTTDTISENLPC